MKIKKKMGRFNVICIDNSKYSQYAFDWYLENYHRNDDKLGLLHVTQMPTYPMSRTIDPSYDVIDKAYEEQIQASIDEVRTMKAKFEHLCKEKSVSHEFILTDSHSSPGYMICKTAEEKNADSVILGQRGLGTISRAMLGSVSDYVLHHADRTVIVVPTK